MYSESHARPLYRLVRSCIRAKMGDWSRFRIFSIPVTCLGGEIGPVPTPIIVQLSLRPFVFVPDTTVKSHRIIRDSENKAEGGAIRKYTWLLAYEILMLQKDDATPRGCEREDTHSEIRNKR